MLTYGLKRNLGFQNSKKVLLSPKHGNFPKKLTHGFVQKIQNFSYLFFSEIGFEIMLNSGLDRN